MRNWPNGVFCNVRLLVDTHALAWWYTDQAQLSGAASRALLDPGNQILVSPVSAWEFATKYRVGKWPAIASIVAGFGGLLDADGFLRLPLNDSHALRAGSYLLSHSDPFDRLLAAQCELEGLPLPTRDPAFHSFPIRTLW
jgi:PIN domain nuclease of toxin-antitoxin system